MKRLLRTACLLVAIAATGCMVFAETVFDPPLGVYHYSVSWGVVDAGKATVAISRDGDFYRVEAHARARGTIDKIYRLRYQGEGTIDADDLTPIKTILRSREGKKRKETDISYNDDGTVKSTETRTKGDTSSTEVREFEFEESVFDPFSAIFLARRVDWHLGYAQEFEVFTGKDHYLVELNAADLVAVEIAGEEREAWVIVPTVENLTRPEKKPKIDSARIYLSADENKDLLKIESEVFVGTVNVKLERFEPFPPQG